jgi:hypothetical protein
MKKKTIIIIVVAVVAVFIFIAVAVVGVGFFVARKVAMQKAGITDMHIDKQDGGKIEFKGGQVEVGKAAEWPKDMPSEVPVFSNGKIKVVTKSEIKNKKGWNVVLEGITSEAAEKYKADLKNNSWNIMQTMSSAQGGSIMAEKDKLQLFMVFDNEKHNASLGVNEKD